MKAAIYCRVSTDNQEREGTSLNSQKDACLELARERGLDIPPDNIFLETYSGLELDRPKFNELREWIRNKEVDVVIAYTLDRISRDPTHFIIFEEELDRASIQLHFVTETHDSSDLGKLISYVKGYSAKLEAEKIRERTMRGKRERIKDGKLPCGRGVLYGYDYDKETGTNIANKNLDIVRMMGLWVINEHIFLNEVCRRLMERNIPAPKGGKTWSRGTVGRILRNDTYAGKTYANKTKVQDKKRIAGDNLIEIPNAVDKTAFTSDEFEMIQDQLAKNRENSPRNQKLNYLLKGMVYCKQCGRKFYGIPVHGYPYYRCSGKNSLLPNVKCDNKNINAKWLEKTVWEHFEKVLQDPDFLNDFLEAKVENKTTIKHYQDIIEMNKTMLATFDEAEKRYMRVFGAGIISDEKLKEEIARVKSEAARSNNEIEKAEKMLDRINNKPPIDEIKTITSNFIQSVAWFNDKQKRRLIEIMGTKVWIDKDMVYIEEELNQVNVNYLSKQIGKDNVEFSLPVSQQS